MHVLVLGGAAAAAATVSGETLCMVVVYSIILLHSLEDELVGEAAGREHVHHIFCVHVPCAVANVM